MGATFRHGNNPLMVDYTTGGSAVSKDDVVVIGDYPHVAHTDIPANSLGALGARGGVYRVDKDGDGGPVFAAGADIDWDSGSELAVAAGSGVHFGYTAAGAGTNDAFVDVVHVPSGLSSGT